MTAASQQVKLSIIIPLYNEQDNIAPLVANLTAFREQFLHAVEVLLIDDGSTDETYNRCDAAAREHPFISCYHFRINLGKSACYNLGFSRAKGELIATMDGDLQDRAEDLLTMIPLLGDKADFIVGWKYRGKSGFHKNLLSKFFNFFIRLTTGSRLHDINCPMRVFRRECVRDIRLNGEMFRFLPLLVSYLGFNVREQKVQNHPRNAGVTKFGMRRYFQGFFDLIIVTFLHRFKQKPMHFFGIIGAMFITAGIGIDGFLVVRGLFFTGMIGHFAMLLFGVMLIIIGFQILLFGFLAALITEKETPRMDAYLKQHPAS